MMQVRIAHLSDIHWGKRFDSSIWNSVKSSIKQFAPQILVVSGDLLDTPLASDFHNLKRELDRLAADNDATLVLVPGNHDVFVSGLVELGWHPDYYHVFAPADSALASAPDFNPPHSF